VEEKGQRNCVVAIVLCIPRDPSAVDISINRLNGRPTYAGVGKIDHDALCLELDAVRGLGATETTNFGPPQEQILRT
jgi:hypothetical protein